VELQYAETRASFTLKDEKNSSILIVTKLIEGNYPNYRQVIPAETKEPWRWCGGVSARVAAGEIMTTEKSNSVKLSFGQKNGWKSRPTRLRSERQGNAGDQLIKALTCHRVQSQVYD